MKITCPFYIKTSHFFSSFDYQHRNEIELTNFASFINISLLNKNISSISIDKLNEVFTLKINISEKIDIEKIRLLLLYISQKISFYLNLSEQAVNPHHGTFYFDIDLFEVNIDDVNFPIKMGMSSGVKFDISTLKLNSCKYPELLEYFYEGLRAELPRSKFFHWFLILEHLEYSERYKVKFASTPLFSEEDKNKIRALAETMEVNDKKDTILKIVGYKKRDKNRQTKLYEYLKDILGIDKIKLGIEIKEFNKSIVDNIIQTRHSLFHPGGNFDQIILWHNLYPLVVEILKKLIIDEFDINQNLGGNGT
ncbi:MAG: hypothetical protein IBX72_01460 [Nitrospirae bacterium]|jgi:hypothetical protein|nr:hypothetical protein [Nitrospirota bacterium]